jgi:Integrase core domain
VQLDTCKIAPSLYQRTAIDHCSRWQVLGLYPDRTAASTLAFLDRVAAEMPFPLQRVQTDRGGEYRPRRRVPTAAASTDRGGEFFAHEVQDRLRDRRIKFRPIRPRAPHLNGKVERAQRTALEEFWAAANLEDPILAQQLEAWRTFDNRHRPHGALGGRTPAERIAELTAEIPTPDTIRAAYHPDKERVRRQNSRYRRLPTDARVT